MKDHTADLPGKMLGQYRIIESIGKGGTTEIYRAYQASLQREVTVKVLAHGFQKDPGFVKKFSQEADVIAHLQHPHIVPLYDFGEHQGEVYIVMAYIRGGTLADLIERSPGGLPKAQILYLLTAIAGALDYAHTRGVVHRDMKPMNILLDENAQPYLADFGLAKFTQGRVEMTNTAVAGTASYMAPEIARSGKSTKLADIYALGVILFEMLTGKLPYQGRTPYNVLAAHVNEPIPQVRAYRVDVSNAMQTVIDKVLAKEPEARYASARELAQAFTEALPNQR